MAATKSDFGWHKYLEEFCQICLFIYMFCLPSLFCWISASNLAYLPMNSSKSHPWLCELQRYSFIDSSLALGELHKDWVNVVFTNSYLYCQWMWFQGYFFPDHVLSVLFYIYQSNFLMKFLFNSIYAHGLNEILCWWHENESFVFMITNGHWDCCLRKGRAPCVNI